MTRPPTTSTTRARAAIFSAAGQADQPRQPPGVCPASPEERGQQDEDEHGEQVLDDEPPDRRVAEPGVQFVAIPEHPGQLATDSDSPNTTAAGHPHPKAVATPVPSAAAARIWTSAPGACRRSATSTSTCSAATPSHCRTGLHAGSCGRSGTPTWSTRRRRVLT